MTAAQCAKAVSKLGFTIDSSAVSRIESGERDLRVSQLLIFAVVFEVDAGWILRGMGHPVDDFSLGFDAGVQATKDAVARMAVAA